MSVFGQEQLTLLDGALHGVGGVRYDHYDDFGDHWTFSGSGTYLVAPTDTRLRLSYAQGFRAPTFSELFEPELGNPDLQAETSWEIDAGFTQNLFNGVLRFEPTYFYRNVHNLIEEVADQLPGPINGVPEGEGTFNVNAQFEGVELITRIQPTRWLTVSGNYTYLNVGGATGEVLNRPRHQGAFAASAQRDSLFAAGDRGTAVLQAFAVGSRNSPNPFSEPEPFEPGRIDGYSRTDLALAYQLAAPLAPLTVTATVRNLFNRDYDTAIGFPAPPAWFLIGLRYQL